MDFQHIACHHIQLDVTYADIDKHRDTYDLWVLLKESAVTKGTYNLHNLRNEWTNSKQYTLAEDSHVISLIPLREYLNKFQGFLDSLKNTPLETNEIEKANTLLAGVDSVRYQVAMFNFGLQTTNPTYNEVKTQLMYSGSTQSKSLHFSSPIEYSDHFHQ